MHFRILKMFATSGFLTALECIKFVFAYSAPPDPLAGLRGTLLLRRMGGEEGKGDEERGDGPLTQIPGCAPVGSHSVVISATRQR